MQHLQETGGRGSQYRNSSLVTAVKFFAFTLLRTLLHFSALAQNSTRFFPIASALFVQKHGGVGYALHPYFVTFLLHCHQQQLHSFPTRRSSVHPRLGTLED